MPYPCPIIELRRPLIWRNVSALLMFLAGTLDSATASNILQPSHHVGLLVKVSTTNEEVIINDNDFISAVYSDTTYSVQKQLRACSAQRAPTLVPYRNNETSEVEIMKVMLPSVSATYNRTSIILAAIENVERQLILDKNVGLRDVVNFAIFCVPTSLSGPTFIASGAFNSYWIIAKPSACTNPSILLHEFGHLYGLKHARQGDDEYGDGTSIMGITSNAQNRCFNGFNFWRLGWFNSDYAREIDTTSDTFASIKLTLATYVDVSKLDQKQQQSVVLLKVDDFYLVYNRQESYNNETGEFPNMVTVTRATDTGESDLVAGLNENDKSDLYQYTNNEMLQVTIQVCNHFQGNTTTLDHFIVAIGITSFPCSSAHSSDGYLPAQPTKVPTRTPTSFPISESIAPSQGLTSKKPSAAIDLPTAVPVTANIAVSSTISPSRSKSNIAQSTHPIASTNTFPHQSTPQAWKNRTPTPSVAPTRKEVLSPSVNNKNAHVPISTPVGQIDNDFIDYTQSPFPPIHSSQQHDDEASMHQFISSSMLRVIIPTMALVFISFVTACCCYYGRQRKRRIANQPTILPTKQESRLST